MASNALMGIRGYHSTSCYERNQHGMKVDPFNLISIFPVLETKAMANSKRTKYLVSQFPVFAVTILEEIQDGLSKLLTNKILTSDDRFSGLNFLF